MSQCARCSFQNAEGKRFCVRCGAPLVGTTPTSVIRCPACGHSNEGGKRFCSRCGTPVAALSSPPAGPRCPACGWANAAGRRFCARCGASIVPAVTPVAAPARPVDDLVGQMLTEYQITEKLGRGGMATVFKAIQTTLRRPAAIKVLDPQLAGDTSLLARFHQEAISAANLEHPHIVPIYEVDEAQGFHFIAMKYIAGNSLKEIIARDGQLALSRVQYLVDQIADALDYAHERGFLHRDVKPSNVMVEAKDYAYLMDFGLARPIESSQLTVAGTVMGTPDYMSPEQAQGDEDLDRRTDVYSLGMMLYEMLTGRAPFSGLSPTAVIFAQITQMPPPARTLRPDLPVGVEAVVHRAIAKNKTARYETAGALAAALRSGIREA